MDFKSQFYEIVNWLGTIIRNIFPSDNSLALFVVGMLLFLLALATWRVIK